MDPHGYHEPPADVVADQELAEVSAERMAELRAMLAKARERNTQQRAKKIEQAKQPVMVSVAPGSGKVRRNGPCPCGSNKKFKKCCLGQVRNGELERVVHSEKKR